MIQLFSISCAYSKSLLPILPIQYLMDLTFTQAAKGVNKEISVKIDAACRRCDGRGHEPGTKVQHCHTCNGSGMVRKQTCCCAAWCILVCCVTNSGYSSSHPVGDREHRSVCHALHMPSLSRQRLSHFHAV